MRIPALLFLLTWHSAAQAAELTVRVQGPPDGAALVLQVYDSANAFGDFRDPAREVRVTASPGASHRIDDVPVGDVAVLVFVDQNANGLLDKNFIGIPKEPLGLSNDYRPKGPPVFERARISVRDGETSAIDIATYRPLGERGRFGVGAGVIGRSSPYAGSDSAVLQPIPAITYNGERLQWLGPNIRYGLLSGGNWRLAASASYRIGVYEEDDSPALAGLGDRDSTLTAGLALRAELAGGVDLLLRYEHDVLDRIGGGAAAARISKGFQAGSLRLAPQLQVNWLSSDLADYDFGVPARAATLIRPEYAVGDAFSVEAGFGAFIELTEQWRILLNVSGEFLPDKITASPIVDDDIVINGFAAITYLF